MRHHPVDLIVVGLPTGLRRSQVKGMMPGGTATITLKRQGSSGSTQDPDRRAFTSGVRMAITSEESTLLRELALGDARLLARLLSETGRTEGALDPVVTGLVRIATLIALGADTPAYQAEVNAALGAGASAAQVIDVLSRVAPIVGSTHAMSAAPRLALALGYDVDKGLESLEVDAR